MKRTDWDAVRGLARSSDESQRKDALICGCNNLEQVLKSAGIRTGAGLKEALERFVEARNISGPEFTPVSRAISLRHKAVHRDIVPSPQHVLKAVNEIEKFCDAHFDKAAAKERGETPAHLRGSRKGARKPAAGKFSPEASSYLDLALRAMETAAATGQAGYESPRQPRDDQVIVRCDLPECEEEFTIRKSSLEKRKAKDLPIRCEKHRLKDAGGPRSPLAELVEADQDEEDDEEDREPIKSLEDLYREEVELAEADQDEEDRSPLAELLEADREKEEDDLEEPDYLEAARKAMDAAAAATLADRPSLLRLTSSSFDRITQQSGIVLIEFFADWCSPCRKLAQILEEVSDEFGGRVTVAIVDVDAGAPQTDELGNTIEDYDEDAPFLLASHLGIRSLPTLLIYKDGQLIDTVIGLIPKEEIRKRVDAALGALGSSPQTSVAPQKAEQRDPENTATLAFLLDSGLARPPGLDLNARTAAEDAKKFYLEALDPSARGEAEAIIRATVDWVTSGLIDTDIAIVLSRVMGALFFGQVAQAVEHYKLSILPENSRQRYEQVLCLMVACLLSGSPSKERRRTYHKFLGKLDRNQRKRYHEFLEAVIKGADENSKRQLEAALRVIKGWLWV